MSKGRAFRRRSRERPSLPPACGVLWSAMVSAAHVVTDWMLCQSHASFFEDSTCASLRRHAPQVGAVPRVLEPPVLCLVCWNHRSSARRRCQLCLRHRALPSCRPEHCWIVEARSCRDCLERFLHRAADQAAGMRVGEVPSRIILSFLQEEDWW